MSHSISGKYHVKLAGKIRKRGIKRKAKNQKSKVKMQNMPNKKARHLDDRL